MLLHCLSSGTTTGIWKREAAATGWEYECRTGDRGTESRVCQAVGPSESEAEDSPHPQTQGW